MDIREFRVGNYYYFNNKIHQLTLSDFVEFFELENQNEYKPIPLTSQWAENFGFKYFKSFSRKNTRTWYLNHFFIYFGKLKGPKINNNYPMPFVHNLQDMWWERFKTELILKQEHELKN